MILLQCVIVCAVVACARANTDRNPFDSIAGNDSTNFGEVSYDGSDERIALVAFSAAKSKLQKGHKQKQYELEYDHVFTNYGGHFNAKMGTFTIPIPGVYEFTFSGGALPHKKLSLQLMKNHFEVQTLAFDGHRKRNPHVQSQKILLELEAGDRIWIRLAASRMYGVTGTSGSGYVTTFTGRLLSSNGDGRADVDAVLLSASDSKLTSRDSSSRNQHHSRSKRGARLQRTNSDSGPIAFSVARTSCVMGQISNRSHSGSTKNGAITFDKSFVNAGKGLDLGRGEFTAPVSGLYFFSFTVGKYPKKRLSVSLIKNNNEFQVMVYDESRSDRRQMQSQSLILELEAGDKIWLKSYDSPNFAVYSNLGNYITFNGYLLHRL